MASLYLVGFFALLFCINMKTRSFACCFLPWMIYAVLYDSMRFYPNYLVNDIDVQGLYEAEKSLFGFSVPGAVAADGTNVLIPGEWFNLHHWAWADILAGLFYLCWIPVPAVFALYLYFKGEKKWCFRYSAAFLVVNLVGFVGYYLHPASAPWYVILHGFEPVVGTPGNMAGLARFDEMTGLSIFHVLYNANANVFAAVPSLHASYLVVPTIYAIMSKRRWYASCIFAFIGVGIWVTAVYTGHHYIIDVLLGILTALVGVLLFEGINHHLRRHRHHHPHHDGPLA